MLNIPRSMFRSLRLLRRKCVVGRPRGPAPPLQFHCQPKGCILAIHFEEVILTAHIPDASYNFDSFQLPDDILDTIDGPGDEAVTVTVSKYRVEVHWNDRGQPRALVVDGQPPEHELPSEPTTMAPMPIEFNSALHEASRTTSREPTRFALHRVQVQGDSGDVICLGCPHDVLAQGLYLSIFGDNPDPGNSAFRRARVEKVGGVASWQNRMLLS